jgi:hypothetical protein
MKRGDELDRILMSAERDILPSSGFIRSVMEAVQNEATAPPPIPFPWMRALPGLAATALAFVWVLVVGLTQVGSQTTPPPYVVALPPMWTPLLEAAAWSALALLVAYASVKLSMRLVRA